MLKRISLPGEHSDFSAGSDSESASSALRLTTVYHIACDAGTVEARAEAIAIEQSVELPLAAIGSDAVLLDIVGEVQGVRKLRRGVFEVRVGLSVPTTGPEAGQLMNMLFGNTSILSDVSLVDVELPDAVTAHFGGPNHGIDGLRARVGAGRRAMTCSALKPQGLSSGQLAQLAGQLARGGIDFVKDDHGLADQAYSPFAERIVACARAVEAANRETGGSSRYVPNVTGNLDTLRAQLRLVEDEGLDTVLVEPIICGLPDFHLLTRSYPHIAFIAHPALAGASRIAPPLLLGKLFRLLGADATIFPNHGGRFSYSPQTCRELADAARDAWGGLKPSLPTPAGGMALERVPELLDFYGDRSMLLIGGSLLAAKERLTEEARVFTSRVARHFENHV